MRAGARQRFLDGLPEHEMRAEQPHRLAGGGAHRRQAEPLHQRLDDALRRLAGMDDAGRDAERPGRGRHQQGGRAGIAVRPVAGLELVLDQAVGGARRRAPAAALRPAPSAPGPPWWRAHRRAGSPPPRRARRRGRGSPSPAAWRGHRCAPRPHRSGRHPSAAGGHGLVRRRIGRPERRDVAGGCGGLCRRHGSASKLGHEIIPTARFPRLEN